MDNLKEYSDYKITKVKLPYGYKSKFRKLSDEIVITMKGNTKQIKESIKNHPLEEGIINKKIIESILSKGPARPSWFLYMDWRSQANEIIDQLNLIISDLITLKNNHKLLSGSPKTRLIFYIRSYLNESFRMKELIQIFTKQLYKNNIISKKEMEGLRDIYYKAFENTLEVRNTIYHRLTDWDSQDFIDLDFLSILSQKGKIDKSNQAVLDYKLPLKKLCAEALSEVSYIGNKMSFVVSQFIKTLEKEYRLTMN